LFNTSPISLVERFESFQKDAVNAIIRDFGNNPRGRYLLVIPTAGGKTLAAAKAINKLFEAGILNSAKDCVLWTAHRVELLDQAEAAYRKLESSTEDKGRYYERVLFRMILSVPEYLSTNDSIKLIIIDEAHHGAADSYQPIFQNQRVGILGLTATPSRHDGVPLDFERESYSIGFPDLLTPA
jgi:superfamily II DNA or RNA helicase